MEQSALEFRRSRLDVLRFISDTAEQRAFALKVHYDNYSSEFYSWWFDDFHPDGQLFSSAFLPREVDVLRRFSEAYGVIDSDLGDDSRGIQELQATPQWGRVMAAAKEALEALGQSQPNNRIERSREA
jgi:hypothetical protein